MEKENLADLGDTEVDQLRETLLARVHRLGAGQERYRRAALAVGCHELESSPSDFARASSLDGVRTCWFATTPQPEE